MITALKTSRAGLHKDLQASIRLAIRMEDPHDQADLLDLKAQQDSRTTLAQDQTRAVHHPAALHRPVPPGGEAAGYYGTAQTSQSRSTVQEQDDSSWYGRVGGIMKRAPSPQQIYDQASKQVTAGMAVAGSALGSIFEGEEELKERSRERSNGKRSERRSGRSDEREGFSDHERWSEEAEEKTKTTTTTSTVDTQSIQRAETMARNAKAGGKAKAKRALAIVVNADTATEIAEDNGYNTEHAVSLFAV